VNGAQQSRNTPALSNIGFGKLFQFDGASASLEAQARVPLLAEDEMGMTAEEIESRLAADTLYVRLFRQAYGNVPITLDGVAKALATYQRTLVSQQSYYDQWKAGDESAVSAAAKRGEAIFIGKKGNCAQCHVPPLFTDGGFHNNGLDSVFKDAGRARVTGLATDSGRFKTPSLRNISVTGPYMHDGRMNTLMEVVEHYNAGVIPHPRTDTILRPLGLTPAEVSDLVAYLEALTDSVFVAQRNT
jgi:cytochrome c peroxidase